MNPRIGLSACLLATALAAAAVPAGAAVFHVTQTVDVSDGFCVGALCTLRDAVLAANAAPGADLIVVPAGTYLLAAGGGAGGGDLDVHEAVTILGAGAAVTRLDAGGHDRVFDLQDGAGSVTLVGLTITGGMTAEDGGGIEIEPGATLVLHDCTVTGNQARSGGGIAATDTPLSGPVITISDSRFANNRAVGAIADGGGRGGGLYLYGRKSIVETTTWSGNSSSSVGGAIFTDATDFTMRHSTVTGNTTSVEGGAVMLRGGMVTIEGSSIVDNGGGPSSGPALRLEITFGSITNSTIADNHGTGIDFYSASNLVASTTIVRNGEAQVPGSDVILRPDGTNGPPTFLATLVGDCRRDGNAVLVSQGGNVETPGDSCGFDPSIDRAAVPYVDLNLGDLGDYGGLTPTIVLQRPSVAIGAGGTDCAALDQRGLPRPAAGDAGDSGACDAGAYEVQANAVDAPCAPDPWTVCMDDAPGDRRFEARITWRTAQASDRGKAISLAELGVRRGGLFTFFSLDNPELLLKVLNACVPALGQNFWVFYAAGTNVEFTLTIRDTRTGAVRTYLNPLGQAAPPVQDIGAFSC